MSRRLCISRPADGRTVTNCSLTPPLVRVPEVPSPALGRCVRPVTQRERSGQQPHCGVRDVQIDLARSSSAVLNGVGTLRAGEPVQVEAQLEATPVAVARDPRRDARGGAVDQDLSPAEPEGQDRPADVVADAGEQHELGLEVGTAPSK